MQIKPIFSSVFRSRPKNRLKGGDVGIAKNSLSFSKQRFHHPTIIAYFTLLSQSMPFEIGFNDTLMYCMGIGIVQLCRLLCLETQTQQTPKMHQTLSKQGSGDKFRVGRPHQGDALRFLRDLYECNCRLNRDAASYYHTGIT